MSETDTYRVFFRTSKTFGKDPIPEANSCITYKSLLQSFGRNEIAVIADNADIQQQTFFMQHSSCCYLTKLGNCGSFKL